jgi:ParB-like chromosome segregation protein Spo0J
MQTVLLPIDLLSVNSGQVAGLPKNPRFIKDERFRQLIQSIRDDPEMLSLRECLVFPHHDRYVVIAGNMRLRALMELGYAEVPCKVLSPETPPEKLRAITIKDNLSFGGDDLEALAAEWDKGLLTEWGMESHEWTPEVGKLIDLEKVAVAELKPHPQNYKVHPDDQLQHIARSIRDHGLFRNVVISADGFIIAGHALVLAVEQMGMRFLPVVRLDVTHDSPMALKLLVADNEISHLAEINDRKLSEVLRDVNMADSLQGTGYDEMMLANLLIVTRSRDEIKDFNAAAEWVGMPEYEPATKPEFKLIVHFATEQDRFAFEQQYKVPIMTKGTKTWTTQHPFPGRHDLSSLKIESGGN